MNKINYVISFGTLCHTAQFLKNNGLKLCSFPFDWIFSTPDIVFDCLEDSFTKLLSKKYYINHCDYPNNNTNCGHSLYCKRMFQHLNPRLENDYNYLKRCISRLDQCLHKKNNKLFIITYVEDKKSFRDKISYFLEKANILNKYTTNYFILVINCIYNGESKINSIFNNGNLFIYDLYTLSPSDGINFSNNIDNENYRNIIYSNFKFELINDIKNPE